MAWITWMLSAISILSLGSTEPACPPGYISLPSFPDCYKIVTKSLTFDESVNECQRESGDLVIVDSLLEHFELQKKLLSVKGQYSFCKGFYWIALDREHDRMDCNDTFVWRRGGSSYTLEFNAFAPGQPDCYVGRLGCVHIWSDLMYMWNDIQCDARMCALCEVPAHLATFTTTPSATTTDYPFRTAPP